MTKDPERNALEIRQISDEWLRAIEDGDMATLGRLLADDVVIVHGSGRQIVGRDAALDDLTESLKTYAVRQVAAHEETAVSGEWAFDRSVVETHLASRSSGVTATVKSRTWTLLKRSAGSWHIARVIGVVIEPTDRSPK